MKSVFYFILLFLGFTYFICPEINAQEKMNIHTLPLDSLRTKSFKELDSIFKENKRNSILANHIARTYLHIAKNQLDTIQIAEGYRMFYAINKNSAKIALKYIDSIISITENINNKDHPAQGYLLKGYILYNTERYNEALEAYLVAKKYAEINNNEVYLIALKHNIALLKTTLRKNREALKTYKENYNYLLQKDTTKKFRSHYLATLYKLADSYNRLKIYDSANFYLKKGIASSLFGNNTSYYPDMLASYGANSYFRKEYTTAIDTLKKTLVLLKEDVTNANVRITYLYLAKTLLKLDKEKEAIKYLKKVDSVVNESNYMIETREAFTLLIEHYKKNQDQNNQLRIMEKLIRLDSISDIKYDKLNNKILTKYDTASLIKDKDALLEDIVNRNKKSKHRFLIINGIIVLLISLFYAYYYIRKKKKFNEKLENVEALYKKKSSSASNLELTPELKEDILKKLHHFEETQGYLKNNLTLSSVSKKIKTNSTYLSKVINLEKQKNFSNYINDLRIEYCVHRIQNDKKFRQYSIKSMAQEVGFNNIQSFAKAFLKKENCNPAEYVKRFNN